MKEVKKIMKKMKKWELLHKHKTVTEHGKDNFALENLWKH